MNPFLKEMKADLPLQLAMNIANTEACLSGSACVEPFHILLAILIIVDDSYAQTAELMALTPDQVKVIGNMAVECRSLLNISDKEITTVRRTLQNTLRKCEPRPLRALKTSNESRYLLHKAARRGYRENLDELNLGLVLPELLASLPDEVAPFFKTSYDRQP